MLCGTVLLGRCIKNVSVRCDLHDRRQKALCIVLEGPVRLWVNNARGRGEAAAAVRCVPLIKNHDAHDAIHADQGRQQPRGRSHSA